MSRSIHPAVDAGVKPRRNARSIWSYINNQPKPGGKLTCKCTQAPVVVSVTAPAAHNHLCGCTKCWKPDDSLFSQIAVVPRDKLHVVKNRDKLKILDETVAIQRHYCSECGTHMYGRVENPDHHFFGLDFIHIELSKDDGWPPIQFAGFVSSIVESGANPSELNDIRNQLSNLGLESYDEFSPELNAYIASRASDLSFKNQVF